jgi:hypothetical protein
MSSPTPLPFKITLPAEERVEFTGYREVSRRADGLLHLVGDAIVLEWALTESIEEVSLENVGSATETFAAEELEIPLTWLAGAELAGGILRPRLVLRARGLGVFADVPGAKGAELALHYRRADRLLAVAMQRAITAARTQDLLPPD